MESLDLCSRVPTGLSGQTDSNYCSICLQFTEDNAKPSFLPGINYHHLCMWIFSLKIISPSAFVPSPARWRSALRRRPTQRSLRTARRTPSFRFPAGSFPRSPENRTHVINTVISILQAALELSPLTPHPSYCFSRWYSSQYKALFRQNSRKTSHRRCSRNLSWSTDRQPDFHVKTKSKRISPEERTKTRLPKPHNQLMGVGPPISIDAFGVSILSRVCHFVKRSGPLLLPLYLSHLPPFPSCDPHLLPHAAILTTKESKGMLSGHLKGKGITLI